jgi:TRAP-type C4-dicarboxylate transport system permease small subunit
MTVGVLIAVFSRYLFRKPIPEGMELAYFAMLWCAFLATGNALVENKHVAMALIRDKLPGRIKIVADICIAIIILFSVVFIVRWSTSLAYESIVKQWYDAGLLGIHMIVLYGIMSLGSIFLGIVAIAKLIEQMKKFGGKINGREFLPSNHNG